MEGNSCDIELAQVTVGGHDIRVSLMERGYCACASPVDKMAR